MQKTIYNPFERTGSYTALVFGLLIILITSLLAAKSLLHFDGILDMHFGGESPVWIFIVQNLINLLVITVVFYLAGIFISPSSVRLIDVLGFQALARIPMFFPALIALFLNITKYNEFLISAILHDHCDTFLTITDWMLIVILSLVVLISIIWMIALMFNAYCISLNLKGSKAVISFIITIIIAEIITKSINFFISYIINDPLDILLQQFS